MIFGRISRREVQYFFLLGGTFLFWPLLAFIISVFNLRLKTSFVYIFFFLGFYGFNFIYTNESMDSYRYAQEYLMMAESSLMEVDFSKYKDYLIPLLTFFVSRVTWDPHYLFAAYALFFGFFYLKSLRLFVRKYFSNPDLNKLIIIVCIALVIPIHQINGIRFWSASWIFFYFGYLAIVQNKKKFILFSYLACLVHVVFIFPCVLLSSFFVLKDRKSIVFLLLIASIVVPTLVDIPGLFIKYSSVTDGVREESLVTYASEVYIEQRNEVIGRFPWFVRWKTRGLFYTLLFLLFLPRYKLTTVGKRLYLFCLYLLSLISVTSDLQSFGGRFKILWFLFVLAFLYHLYEHPIRRDESSRMGRLRPGTLMLIPPMMLYSAVDFRVASETFNAFMLIGNPFTSFFLDIEILLHDLIF